MTQQELKGLYVKTYGCQMNVYDSERMMEALRPLGYQPCDTPEEAAMVLLNTCHIREKAAEKVYSELGRLRDLRLEKQQQGSEMLIGVAGCVAQAEGEEMLRRAPYVDLVVGPQAYHNLPELVARAHRKQQKILATDFPTESKFDFLPNARTPSNPHTVFLTIQEGCDKFCTFCVVPYTRGSEYSRPVSAILAEAKELIAGGAKEITLLGQNVNAYHGEGMDGKVWGLARLLYALAEIEGVERLRYTTSHPRDMDESLIAAHGAIPQLMPLLHLPVQSGSDRILAAMNRKHTAAEYFSVIEKLRNVRADIAFSSDFIVGYPNESDAEFAETLHLIQQVGFASAYSFIYSPRAGTPASLKDDSVTVGVKKERLTRLQELITSQQQAFNLGMVGKTVPVLFDRCGDQDGQLLGRTPWLQPVHTTTPDTELGMIKQVKITAANTHRLVA